MQSIRLNRRKALTALGAAVGTASLAAPSLAKGSSEQSSLERAVEELRAAMVAGDRAALERLLHDQLRYLHSSGQTQTRANLLSDLAGKKFFASLIFPEASIVPVDCTGIANLTVDQVKNLPDGKTRASRIKVLQTWTKTPSGWKLLGRMSAIISSPIMQPCRTGTAPSG